MSRAMSMARRHSGVRVVSIREGIKKKFTPDVYRGERPVIIISKLDSPGQIDASAIAGAYVRGYQDE